MIMYSNAKYVRNPYNGEISAISVDINGMPSFVPIDPENVDYQNLMELEREGKIVIQPADGEQQ